MKSRGGKSPRREDKKNEDQRREKIRRKRMQARERVQEARITVFSMICGSGRWKTKAAGAEPSGQMRNKKLHAAVSRSMFPRQNVQHPFSIEARLGIELSKKCTVMA